MRIGIFIASLLIVQIAFSQISHETLDGGYWNTMDLRLNSNGIIGIDLSDNSPSSDYKESGNHYLNQAGIWVLAEDYDGNIYTAVQHVDGPDSVDFWGGPLDIITGQASSSSGWNNVWKISRQMIDSHRNNFTSSGYEMPDDIKNWPANGGNGFNNYLGAFQDYNKNDFYDPENGDVPYIKGEEALYCVFNDVASEHKASLGSEIGLEIYLMAYRIEDAPGFFLEYDIVSRSATDYKDVKIGFFMGGELGNKNDNYVGTNLELPNQDFRDYVFMYQGDTLDEGHFNKNLPAISAAFLNKQIVSSIAFNNSDNNQRNGTPKVQDDYINYMNSRWLDGSQLTKGGDGMSADSTVVSHIFHPAFGNLRWTEKDANQTPGTRNVLAMSEAGSLARNEHIRFKIGIAATNYANFLQYDDLHEFVRLMQIAERGFLSNGAQLSHNQHVKVYPNPTTSNFEISVEIPEKYKIEILDNQGVILFVENVFITDKYVCNVPLSSGIYNIRLTNHYKQYNKPLIVIK